jgi:hypothetical protein
VSTLVRETLVLGFFAILAVVATRPLVADLAGTTLVGPDPLIDLWTVNWVSGHLLKPEELYGGNVFAPTPHAVVFSDLSLGTAVLVAPLRFFVRDPVPLYNAGVLLALTFAGWSFCALTRHLTGNIWSGLLAGVLAAFGSHQMSHIYHLNLLTTGWLALFLLGLHRLVKQPSWGSILLAGISFALSAQSSGYYAVGAAVLGLLFAVVHIRELQDRRVFGGMAGVVLLAGLLTLPYFQAFMAVQKREGLRRPPGMSSNMAFHPGADLSSVSYLYRPLLGSRGERLFPGILSLVLATVAVRRRRPHTTLYLAAVGLLALLSLGPRLDLGGISLPLPYRALFAVPPLNTMRHPYTFAALAVFALAVLAGLGWAELSLRRGGPWVVLLAVFETLWPGVAVRRVPGDVPAAYGLISTLPPGVILEVPPLEPETMLWAARHGLVVVNGAGAFVPARTLLLERYIQNHWIAEVPTEMEASPPTDLLKEEFPVRYVILPTGRKAGFGPLRAAFERSHTFALVGVTGDGDRVYEMRKDLADAREEGKHAGEVLSQKGEAVRDEEHTHGDQ